MGRVGLAGGLTGFCIHDEVAAALGGLPLGAHLVAAGGGVGHRAGIQLTSLGQRRQRGSAQGQGAQQQVQGGGATEGGLLLAVAHGISFQCGGFVSRVCGRLWLQGAHRWDGLY